MSSPRRSLPRRPCQEKKPKPNTPYPSSISRKGNYTFIIYIEKGNLTTERTFFASPESASAQAANHQNLILTRLKKFPQPTFQDNGKIFRNTKNSQKGVNLRDFAILKKKGGCHEKTRKQTFVPLGTFFDLKMAIFMPRNPCSFPGNFEKVPWDIFQEIKGGGVGGSDNFQPF